MNLSGDQVASQVQPTLEAPARSEKPQPATDPPSSPTLSAFFQDLIAENDFDLGAVLSSGNDQLGVLDSLAQGCAREEATYTRACPAGVRASSGSSFMSGCSTNSAMWLRSQDCTPAQEYVAGHIAAAAAASPGTLCDLIPRLSGPSATPLQQPTAAGSFAEAAFRGNTAASLGSALHVASVDLEASAVQDPAAPALHGHPDVLLRSNSLRLPTLLPPTMLDSRQAHARPVRFSSMMLPPSSGARCPAAAPEATTSQMLAPMRSLPEAAALTAAAAAGASALVGTASTPELLSWLKASPPMLSKSGEEGLPPAANSDGRSSSCTATTAGSPVGANTSVATTSIQAVARQQQQQLAAGPGGSSGAQAAFQSFASMRGTSAGTAAGAPGKGIDAFAAASAPIPDTVARPLHLPSGQRPPEVPAVPQGAVPPSPAATAARNAAHAVAAVAAAATAAAATNAEVRTMACATAAAAADVGRSTAYSEDGTGGGAGGGAGVLRRRGQPLGKVPKQVRELQEIRQQVQMMALAHQKLALQLSELADLKHSLHKRLEELLTSWQGLTAANERLKADNANIRRVLETYATQGHHGELQLQQAPTLIDVEMVQAAGL